MQPDGPPWLIVASRRRTGRSKWEMLGQKWKGGWRRRWRRRERRREEGEEKEQHQVTKRPWSLREGSMLSELEIRMLQMVVDEEFGILLAEVDMVVEQSKMLSEVEVNNNKDKLLVVFFWLLHFVTTFSYDFWRS